MNIFFFFDENFWCSLEIFILKYFFLAVKYAKDIRHFTFQNSSNYNYFFCFHHNNKIQFQKRDDKELKIVSNYRQEEKCRSSVSNKRWLWNEINIGAKVERNFSLIGCWCQFSFHNLFSFPGPLMLIQKIFLAD